MQLSIVIPTYNERENIPLVLDGIREEIDGIWEFEVIVVDDNSPDGTGDLVKIIAANDSRVRLLQRESKKGLGSAVLDGFRIAQGRYLVMMDGDGSHRPKDVKTLVGALQESDIVVGSRYVSGGGSPGFPIQRKIVSLVASLIGRFITGLPIRDITSGFAGFRREVVEPLLPFLKPKGFKLLLEILSKSRWSEVAEVPIIFAARRTGKSKFSPNEIIQYLRLCLSVRSTRSRPRIENKSTTDRT